MIRTWIMDPRHPGVGGLRLSEEVVAAENAAAATKVLLVFPYWYGMYPQKLRHKNFWPLSKGLARFAMSTFQEIIIRNNRKALRLLSMLLQIWLEEHVMKWTGSELRDERLKLCLPKNAGRHRMK